jgi:hypothetical protein
MKKLSLETSANQYDIGSIAKYFSTYKYIYEIDSPRRRSFHCRFQPYEM